MPGPGAILIRQPTHCCRGVEKGLHSIENPVWRRRHFCSQHKAPCSIWRTSFRREKDGEGHKADVIACWLWNAAGLEIVGYVVVRESLASFPTFLNQSFNFSC